MIEYLLKYQKVTILFIVMAMLVGSLSFALLHKKENPEIALTVARVQTVYPGASPEMIEQLVTKPLEEKIKNIEEVIKIQSTSTVSLSTIMVEIKPGSVEDNRKVWNELKQKVQSVEADLPSGSHKPVVNDNLGKIAQQIYQFIVDSPVELEELRFITNEWQEELSKLQGVSDVDIVGLPKQEVSVHFDVEKLNQLQLPWAIVLQAIENSYNRVPLGSIQEEGSFSLLQLEGEWISISDVEDIVVFHNGQSEVLLKDIATVELSTTKAHELVMRNGKPALSVVINSNSGVDVLSLQKGIDEKVIELKENLPDTVEVISEFSQKESVDLLFLA